MKPRWHLLTSDDVATIATALKELAETVVPKSAHYRSACATALEHLETYSMSDAEVIQYMQNLGALNAAAMIGAKGGVSRSDAKREAAKANGAKGGRPRREQFRFSDKGGGVFAVSEYDKESQAYIHAGQFQFIDDDSDDPWAYEKLAEQARERLSQEA